MTLNEMTVPELRKIAAQFKVTGRSTMKKAELINALSAPEVADLVELSISLDETAAIEADADTMEAIAEAEAEFEENTPEEEAAYKAWFDAKVAEQQAAAPPIARVVRDAPGAGFVKLRAHRAIIVREGRRWVLQTATGETMTIRARSIGKAVKAWAKRLDIMLDDIIIEKEF